MEKKSQLILSIDKTGKDQGKADYANAFIGFGVERRHALSSTGRYLNDAIQQGIPVNYAIKPDTDTVVFVSVSSEGIYVEKTINLIQLVLKNGATVIMDKQGTGFGESHSRFNINGEGKVHDFLGKPNAITKEGYSVWFSQIEKVVHCKQKPYDVYIGRPSKWGNPFSHKSGTKAKYFVDSRHQAVEAFKHWITQGEGQHLLKDLPELKGKVLGCWCAPKSCHGHVLAELTAQIQ